MTKKLQSSAIARWLCLVAGLELVALAVNFFYGPISIAVGGTTGLSILVQAVWGWPRPLVVLAINVIMLIVAAIFLGKQATRNIAVGSFLLPILMEITPSFKVTNNDFVAVIYGGALVGLGMALLYRVNASSGGTTVLPMILEKYFYLSTTIGLLLVDLVIIGLNLFVDGWEAFLLAVLSQIITALTMRFAEVGFDRKYQLRIMSNEHLPAIQQVLEQDYQGLTIFNVIGGYSKDQKQQLLIVVDPQEYGALLAKIHEIDPQAFITTETVAKVHGGRWGM
ncbi:MAG: YitT family protein [Lactobacillus sp.]|jgi:uncharacterized membrane-anchored protein YitT (DUF2179 family)|nr:YitT family protein [Lactobacillus sp.]MCH3906096.1 YitT family protein [Lactobacillus sp.]MCH3990326.1 YitT family protein [Lactobacillus sp.]MCH4068959.1 YitT family protein [Lactobacillus sp.]MCI1303361.1 YitT family protein [Lactobacillus sp.]